MTAAEQAVARLAAVFGEPRTPDPTAFFEEYTRALEGYDAAALDAAVSQAIRESAFWPRPAEIIAMARTILDWRRPRRPAEHAPIDVRLEPSPEQKARVKALLADALASLRAAGEARQPADPLWWRGQRDALEAVQRARPERHRDGGDRKRPGLTSQSKRLLGDRDEPEDTP